MTIAFQKVAHELVIPQSGDLERIRTVVARIGNNPGLSDLSLLEELSKSGLRVAPLLGRKVAITGSAVTEYTLHDDGTPIIGIGDAVAEAMLANGANVVVNSYTPSMHEGRLEYLRSYGRPCEYVQADMSTAEAARNFVRKAHETLGGLDVLVLNTGTYCDPALSELSEEIADRTYAINVRAPLAAAKEYIKLVGDTVKRGRIIFTSSINAQLSETSHLSYDGSKGALEASARALALDVAKMGLDIRVNCVAPGLIYTSLTYKGITRDPETHRQLDEGIPCGIGFARDVVAPYVMLASAENNYMTGTVVDASGGLRITQATERYPHG